MRSWPENKSDELVEKWREESKASKMQMTLTHQFNMYVSVWWWIILAGLIVMHWLASCRIMNTKFKEAEESERIMWMVSRENHQMPSVDADYWSKWHLDITFVFFPFKNSYFIF